MIAEFEVTNALADESISPTFESRQEYFEYLLQHNFSSPDLPAKFNSMAKIVAEALCRLDLLTVVIGRPGQTRNFVTTFDRMWDRIDKLRVEVTKAGGWRPKNELLRKFRLPS
jgi:hypothetical protein